MGASVKHAGERMGDDDHMHVVPVLARPDCELSQGWFGVCHAMVDRISCRRPRLCLLLPGPPTRCDRAGHSARGVINQFVGDETFVAFGAPIPLRDCVEKAAQCALAMIERMQAINDSLGKVISKAGLCWHRLALRASDSWQSWFREPPLVLDHWRYGQHGQADRVFGSCRAEHGPDE
jgi:class 3 adenylate cyclase